MQIVIRGCLVTLACVAALPVVAGDSFRCGSKIIVTGMTQAEVLEYCGPPAQESEETVPVRSGNQVVGETRSHRWTYQSYGATRVLVFDQDVLKSIQ